MFHFKGPVGYIVQEKTVVGDDDISPGKALEKVFQPLYGLDVQMVSGLVQKQQVGPAQEHFGQLELGLLPAAEKAYRHPHLLLGEAQALQGAPGPGPAGKAALGGEFLVEEHLPLNEGFVRVDLEALADVLQFPLHFQKRGENRHHLVIGAAVQIPAHVLFHIAHAALFGLIDLSAVRGEVAGENFKQGGFPRTIGPYQADMVAILYFKRSPRKNQVFPEGFLQLADTEQCHNIGSLLS